MKGLNEAYTTLSDEIERTTYDRELEAEEREPIWTIDYTSTHLKNHLRMTRHWAIGEFAFCVRHSRQGIERSTKREQIAEIMKPRFVCLLREMIVSGQADPVTMRTVVVGPP